MNTINPGLESGSKITWEDVVTQTPWMAKQLKGMTAAQEMMVRCQALPVLGKSSELEVVLEKKYSEQLLHPKGRGKLVAENPTGPGHKPLPPPPRLTKVGRGETLKLHLKRAARGDAWSIEDLGPRVGHPSQSSQETSTQQEGGQTVQPGCSPLTSELLAPGEELTEVLDYEDVEENDPGIPDPEIAQAVAHIPPANAFAGVEMQESQPPPGFEPEVSRSGYDVNLVCSNPTELGSTSPVTVMGKRDVGQSDFQNTWSWPAGCQGRPQPCRRKLIFWGLIPQNSLYLPLKMDHFPALDGRLNFRRQHTRRNSILIRFASGADTFRASRTGPIVI